MNKLYIVACMFLLGSMSIQEIKAQKTLKVRVSNVFNTPGTDCDAVNGDDSDWSWQFLATNTSSCVTRTNNSANNFNPNVTLSETTTYYSRDCWPTGSFPISFRGYENDHFTGVNCAGALQCFLQYSSVSRAYPAYNAANGNITSWNDITRETSCGCPRPITYGYDAQYIVRGSDFDADNLNSNGFVNNTSCATAMPIGDSGGNFATQCNTTWYVYDLNSRANTLTVNPSQDSSIVTIYSGLCDALCQRASGLGSATVNVVPAGRYLVSIGPSGGENTSISVVSGFTSGLDDIQIAPTITPNFSATVNNNFFTEAPGEPNPAGGIFNTWWYTFVGCTTKCTSRAKYKHPQGLFFVLQCRKRSILETDLLSFWLEN